MDEKTLTDADIERIWDAAKATHSPGTQFADTVKAVTEAYAVLREKRRAPAFPPTANAELDRAATTIAVAASTS